MQIPQGFADLFDDASRAFLALATVRASGDPVVVPVWFVSDATGLLFTTDLDALKAKDMRARSQVGAMVMSEGEHERYVSVRGRAVEASSSFSPAAADELHHRIVRRYTGHPPEQPFEGAIFRLVPARMTGYDYREMTV